MPLAKRDRKSLECLLNLIIYHVAINVHSGANIRIRIALLLDIEWSILPNNSGFPGDVAITRRRPPGIAVTLSVFSYTPSIIWIVAIAPKDFFDGAAPQFSVPAVGRQSSSVEAE